MTQQIIDNGTTAGDGTGESLFAAFAKVNVNFAELYQVRNRSMAFEPALTDSSLAHLDTWAIGDTYQVSFYDSAAENGSSGTWQFVVNTNLGPVGSAGYRMLYGQPMAGAPGLLATLASIGFTAGQTVIINGVTITLVSALTTETSTQKELLITGRLRDLLAKMQSVMAANSSLGDRSRVDYASTGISIHSSDANNLVTGAITLGGTGLSLLALPSGSYTFPTGFCIEGTTGRLQFVPGAGSVVDIRALGNKCDGVTPASRTRFQFTLNAGAALGWFLVNDQGTRSDGSGRLLIRRTFDARRASCDLAIQAGTRVDSGTASGLFGDFFNEAAHITYLADKAAWVTAGSNPDTEPTNPNTGVDVFQFYGWDDTTQTAGTTPSFRGHTIYGAGDASNSLHCFQHFDMRGDGNFNYTTRPTAAGPLFEGDNSSAANYTATGAYLAFGLIIRGNQEKHTVSGTFTYCEWMAFAVYTIPSESPDSLLVDLSGQNCRHGVWEEQGFDSSIHWKLRFEGQDNPGDGSPCVWLANGKYSKLSGVGRSWNGPIPIMLWKSSNAGVDTVEFDFTLIDCYGEVRIEACRYVEGRLMIRDGKNYPGTESAAIRVDRVVNAANFYCTIVKDQHRESVRFGDISARRYANGLYSKSAHMGHYAITRSLVGPFLSDGLESGSWPTAGIKGVVVEKMKGGTIDIMQCDGAIDILADVTGNASIIVPRDYDRTITKNVSAVCSIGYLALDATGLTIV